MSYPRIDSTCPFDCCQIWKGFIPEASKIMTVEDYLEFMLKEKQKRLTNAKSVQNKLSHHDVPINLNDPNQLLVGRNMLTTTVQPIIDQNKEANNHPKRVLMSNETINTITKKKVESVECLKKCLEAPNLFMRSRQLKSRLGREIEGVLSTTNNYHQNYYTNEFNQFGRSSSNPVMNFNLVACPKCGSYCLSENDLVRHMKEKHSTF